MEPKRLMNEKHPPFKMGQRVRLVWANGFTASNQLEFNTVYVITYIEYPEFVGEWCCNVIREEAYNGASHTHKYYARSFEALIVSNEDRMKIRKEQLANAK